MSKTRVAILLALSLALPGCGYKRLVIIVKDEVTQAPVENALVEVQFRGLLDPFTPRPVTASTDARGIAEMKVADRGTLICVRSTAYPEETWARYWYVVDKDGNRVNRLKARAGEKYVYVYLLNRLAGEGE